MSFDLDWCVFLLNQTVCLCWSSWNIFWLNQFQVWMFSVCALFIGRKSYRINNDNFKMLSVVNALWIFNDIHEFSRITHQRNKKRNFRSLPRWCVRVNLSMNVYTYIIISKYIILKVCLYVCTITPHHTTPHHTILTTMNQNRPRWTKSNSMDRIGRYWPWWTNMKRKSNTMDPNKQNWLWWTKMNRYTFSVF